MRKNIKKSNENSIKCKISIAAHIILEKEEDIYTVHCLEYDIVADGKTKKKL